MRQPTLKWSNVPHCEPANTQMIKRSSLCASQHSNDQTFLIVRQPTLKWSNVHHCAPANTQMIKRSSRLWPKDPCTFHSIYDYFALLKAFNTNTLNFHQYLKDKLSSHQKSHMHNTRHRTNSNFNTQQFNRSKIRKMLFVPSNSHMEQPSKSG